MEPPTFYVQWLHLVGYLDPPNLFWGVAPFAIWSHPNIGISYCDILRPQSGHVTDSRDLTKVAVASQMSGHHRTVLGTLEDKKRSGRQHSPIKKKLTFVFFLLYGTPAPSSECQHPEAWPASTYGYFREGYLRMKSTFQFFKKGDNVV